MTTTKRETPADAEADSAVYRLEDQIGFVIRKAAQRHTAIFAKYMVEQLTPTQWAALVKINELEAVSQNRLGRETAMDVATIKGVVDRLIKRELVAISADPSDSRRNLIALSEKGKKLVRVGAPVAMRITEDTWKRLTVGERQMLLELLGKIS